MTATINPNPSNAAAGPRWTRADYAHDAITVARRLLGAVLVRRLPDGARLAARIVETEAYLGPIDRAAHSYRARRTPRVEAMYGPPGTAYVFFTYGMHHCFNVVCADEDEPFAVLVRAAAPLEGLAAMRRRRDRGRRKSLSERDLGSGPAKLCQAMAIDLTLNGVQMTQPDPPVWVEWGADAARPPPGAIQAGPRIGVAYAGAWARTELRYWLEGDPHVSR